MRTLELKIFCVGEARSSFSMSSFFAINDFYFINSASMNFLLDQIYIKRPCNSFFKIFFVQACFPLDNTYKISQLLLFQLKKNDFPALEMHGAIIDF